jgi:geranylgeranyl pyrophosphate synthase
VVTLKASPKLFPDIEIDYVVRYIKDMGKIDGSMDELWDTLESLNHGIRREVEALDRRLIQSLPNGSPLVLYKASKHLIEKGGKRIRPTLLMLSHNAVSNNNDSQRYAPIAIALELIHTATIIHDDIIDLSSLRRGVKTVNAQWGNDVALVAGDLIFSRAYGLIAAQENSDVAREIYRACRRLAEGQVLEAMHTADTKMTEEVYLEIIERKTASLFEACTKCGAILGDGQDEEVRGLGRYGFFLGIGFQMIDDVLDINSVEPRLGKPIGADISLGKPTFVILHALKEASTKDRETLENIISRRNVPVGEVKMALRIIKGTNSLQYARKRASYFIAKAKRQLNGLEDSPAKAALQCIADYAISRDF